MAGENNNAVAGDLKTCVLRANYAQAISLTNSLLRMPTPAGTNAAKRIEIENGWQVSLPLMNDSGVLVETIIFEYTRREASEKIRFDGRVVTVS